MFALGTRRGLPFSNNHLRHFYEPTSYAKSTAAHMLGSGLHFTHFPAQKTDYSVMVLNAVMTLMNTKVKV
jgi:hypothetical protein